MPSQPNILFLFNDHQAFYRHGWDKGPKIQRPNFDRMANDGICFSRAYSASPLCGPVRRSILTGQFPHTHGEIRNDTNHPFDQPTYLDSLAAEGYCNYYLGKWHAGPGTAFDHHCKGFSNPSYSNPYTKPEYKAYLKRKGLPEPKIKIERVFQPWDPPRIALMEAAKENGTPYVQDGDWCNEHACGIMTTPKETHESFFLADMACEQLRAFAAQPDQEPFCLRVDFWGPHQPYFVTQEFADMYKPSDIPEYGSFNDALENKPETYRHEDNRPLGKDRKLIHPNPLPWSEWQKVLALCYAHSTMIDAAAGLVLDELDKLGLADNTLVVWTTDHGDAIACHGGHFDKDAYMPEEMLRIPMALRWPGKIPAGQKSTALTSSVDIAPTLLDAAGAPLAPSMQGSSLIPLATGKAKQWREDIMCEMHGHCIKHICRAIVAERYKYVANAPMLDELYDLEADPYELHNLIHDSAYASVLADMCVRLKRWQQQTGDTLFKG